jgi:TonB-linked SusC/RagA family outer membrane protein
MGPHIPAYADAEQTRLFHGLLEGRNAIPYIETDYSGYQKNNKKWFQSSAALNYDIPGIDGLSAKALVSYDYYNSDYTEFRKSWNQYRYDEASETYSIWTLDAPDRVNRQYHLNNQILAQVALNFDRAFDVHKVNARLIWEMQKRDGDNFYAQRDLILPMPYLFAGSTVSQIGSMNAGALYKTANNALAGRANYTYSDKYLLELLFRYDGSSRFGSGHQYGFFPAASVGWRISEESFFKNSKLSFIEQLKIRASYGVLGDDAGSSYQFLTGYTYPAPTDHPRFAVGGNVFDGNYVDGAVSMGIPNTQITWYTSNTLNIGFDFSAWNGLLGATVEYFDRHRKGLLARRIGDIPTVVGASIPVENLNSDKTFGLEIELSHRNKIGDVRYGLKGMFSVTRLKQLHVESNPYSSSWDNWKNNINDRLYNQASGEGNFGTYVNNASGGQNWTYGDAGHYTSWEDIWSSDIRLGRSTILGDYKSVDWNGDGVINSNDRYINRYGSRPLMNFSLIANTEYKGFDLQLLFQGSAMSKFTYIDGLSYPFWGGVEASGMKQFTDRWHPVDPLANPYDPATKWTSGYYAYTGSRPNQDAEVNMVNSDYLRLKSVELGYSFPIKNTLKKLRLYVNAYNLLTFSAMKWVDPEHPEDEVGCMYPLNKSVSVGLNLNF